MEWLDDSEKTLDSEVEIANEPDKIKTQLVQHKVMNYMYRIYFLRSFCQSFTFVYSIVLFII